MGTSSPRIPVSKRQTAGSSRSHAVSHRHRTRPGPMLASSPQVSRDSSMLAKPPQTPPWRGGLTLQCHGTGRAARGIQTQPSCCYRRPLGPCDNSGPQGVQTAPGDQGHDCSRHSRTCMQSACGVFPWVCPPGCWRQRARLLAALLQGSV